MPRKLSPEIRQEAVRLRTEEHLGLNDIAHQLGISKGTASSWLREHPLPPEVVSKRQARNGRQVGLGLRKNRGDASPLWALVEGEKFSSSEIGKIAEAAVLLRALLFHLTAYGSPFDGDQADWVLESPDGNMHKVQVKTVRQGAHGLPTVPLVCNDGKNKRRYREGEFDFIVGYDLFTDTAYVWSWDEVAHLKAAVTVCPEAGERWDKIHLGVVQPG